MIGFCDLLLLRHPVGDQSFVDIMQIKQNANRAANLVRQLLAFSRQQTMQPRVLVLPDVLAELSHLLKRLLGTNIELKMVHGRGIGLVKVDQGQFEQVIINLAVNARDAMPDGGTLTIATRNVATAASESIGDDIMPAGDYVRIEVADNGCGMSPAELEQIFEPFFTTKEAGAGVGLGLSTVYGIIKQTGGFIIPQSVEGEGAQFSIYLPRAPETEEAVAAEPGVREPGRDLTGAATILLVEDEGPVRQFAQRALRNHGYQVLEAESGAAALALLERHDGTIDLVITDVGMPHMDGPTLVRHAIERRPDLKVLLISGYAEDMTPLAERAPGAQFLAKPFSLKELAGKVKEVLEAPAG